MAAITHKARGVEGWLAQMLMECLRSGELPDHQTMSLPEEAFPICRRCHLPVRRNRDSYDVFEHMHWACFHYDMEHDGGLGDPDIACRDPHCPARAFDPHPQPPAWNAVDPGSPT